jgi:beta-lactam-binding protein with PASTA domain
LPSFTVTAAGQKVNLDPTGAAQAPFTITNTSAQTLKGRLLTRPRDPAKPEWLSIVGEPTRDFGPNAAEQVVVQLNVPPGTAPGSYSFRLDAVSEVDPDEDFTEGPSVAFDVAPPPVPEKKKFPLWILIVVGAVVLLIIIGVAVWLVTRDGGDAKTVAVPEVRGMAQPVAQQVLAGAGFQAAVRSVSVFDPSLVGMVRTQDPAPPAQAAEGSVVTIGVGRIRITTRTTFDPSRTIRETVPLRTVP